MATTKNSFTIWLSASCVAAAGLMLASEARAQQSTFHLDRLEMPGSPDDGLVLFRPVTQPKPTFFAQLGLGYQLRPLHTNNITTDKTTLDSSHGGVIQDQFATYATVGLEVGDRFIAAATLPVAWIQDGYQPNFSGSLLNTNRRTSFSTSGPGAGDMRIDFRAVAYRSPDRTFAVGAQLSVFAPTGTASNFGGDGLTSAMVMGTIEYTPIRWITLVANTGFHFRPDNSINDPQHDQGLGIGNEWRWAVGGFIPLKDEKGFERFRIGGTIFGQTGIESSNIIGDTAFTKRNTPVEYNGEFRMRFGPKDNWWWGAGAGSRILNGYGAPELRIVGLIGVHFPLVDSDATSPDRKALLREKWKNRAVGDADHDGVPDDVDACPNDPEDHLGNDPGDGCPLPPDKDGDGIPDQYDRCPDKPEDKDGVDDSDGCPEDDADQDGIPDAQDHCPNVPGHKNPDPKVNGCPTSIEIQSDGKIFVLQQVHFETGSTVIAADSFPMLQEIAEYLKVTTKIRKMSIEGHTDDRGDAAMNLKLSQGRATSVMTWLSQHGIEASRLEAHGYGEEKPLESNDTDAGRKANRRVEFKITEQSDPSKPGDKAGGDKP